MFFSTAAGFVRGFVKDFFSTCAWFGSGFIAVWVAPYLTPAVNEYIQEIVIARSMAVGISYLIVLVVLLLLVSLTSQNVKAGFLSGIDRAIGVLFGLFRGIGVLVCFCILMLTFEIPKDKYSMVKNSKLSVVLFDAAEYFMPKMINIGLVDSSKKTIPAKKVTQKRPVESVMKRLIEIKERFMEKVRKRPAKSVKETPVENVKERLMESPKIKMESSEKKPDRQETKTNNFLFFQKIREFINRVLSQKEEEIDSRRNIPQVTVTTTNRPKYGSMSLMEARIKRRAKRKSEKIKREIQKRLDREAL
jgi:membrane protein required for colicin V production